MKTVAGDQTVPYREINGRMYRRPSQRASIDAHRAIGRRLKAVHESAVGKRTPRGLFKLNSSIRDRVDSIRSELDGWCQCEYTRAELPDPVFLDLYYHPQGGTEVLAASEIPGVLAETRRRLVESYPACAPLNAMLTSLDKALAAARKWNPAEDAVAYYFDDRYAHLHGGVKGNPNIAQPRRWEATR